jgi:hypothetical protein
MPQPMSLSEMSLACPEEAKRIEQLIQHAREHFDEELSFDGVIKKISSMAGSENGYSSFYLNSFMQTVRSKTLHLANLRFIKDNCPAFFRLLPGLLNNQGTNSAFSATDDCDPMIMNFMEIAPRDMEAVKEKMAMHAYLFEGFMRAHCNGRGLVAAVPDPVSPFEEERAYNLPEMLAFFESRYSDPSARFMSRSSVGRWLQLRSLNAQVQSITGDTTSADYLCSNPERQAAYQAMLGLNAQGCLDFERWCAASDQEVADATQYFFPHSIQYSADNRDVKNFGPDIKTIFVDTAHVMLLTGCNPVQVFTEIQRRCVVFSEHFENDPLCKHVIEELFPRMPFYPFKFMWPSLGLTEEDFRGLKAHQILESTAEYLPRFGGFGIVYMLSYSQHSIFAKAHPHALASHEAWEVPVEQDLARFVKDIEEFCSNVKTGTPQIHLQFLNAIVLEALSHEVIQSEVLRILEFKPRQKMRTSHEDFLEQRDCIRLGISRIPQQVFDNLVDEANKHHKWQRLDLLLSLRAPSQHLIQRLPEHHHATVLANDLGL